MTEKRAELDYKQGKKNKRATITPLLHPSTVAHNTWLVTFGHLVATTRILRDDETCVQKGMADLAKELHVVNVFELKSLLNRVEDRARKLNEAVVDGVKRTTRLCDKV